jgi:hypothetical protein
MEYAVEMGSGAMIYMPSFINTGSFFPSFLLSFFSSALQLRVSFGLLSNLSSSILGLLTGF